MIAHLILALTFFFTTMAGGLQDLILVLILWCGSSQMHYCHLIIYMLMVMYNWVSFVTAFGLMIQRGTLLENYGKGGAFTFGMLLMTAFLIFYPTATYFVFKAYKEFKGMLFDNGMGGGGSAFGGMFGGGVNRRSSMGAGQEVRYQPPAT